MSRARLDPDSLEQVRIIIRVPADVKERLEAHCADRGSTVSKAIRTWIDRELARNGKRAAE